MLSLLRRLADNSNPTSFANRLRQRRFERIWGLLDSLPRPVTLLDVGGTEHFWQMMGVGPDSGFNITLLNTYTVPTSLPHISSVVGDGCNMPMFSDCQFDVVFSNSVIEHVGGTSEQRCMAAEIMRVGKRFIVQTPNRHFPVEPHFLFPFFQFLPEALQVALLRRFKLGWFSRAESREEALRSIASVRLLTAGELQALFPASDLVRERVFGLCKSLTVLGGWADQPVVPTTPQSATSA